MKNQFKIVIALLFAFASISMSAQEKKNEKAVIKTNIYCDHCKECPTCGKNLQASLLKIKGVKMYELDDKKMTITLYYNGQKTNIGELCSAISNLGYDADDVKANPKAYEQLDGCCKKA